MIKQVFSVMLYNYLGWHKNIRVMLTFGLAFILCFLLSDKAVGFAQEYGTSMQIVEAFVWTFGDSNSILLTSTLLLLLFADMPQLSPATPFYLMRINRKTWMIGQATYIISATFLYLIFILTATALVCMTQSFIGNVWSETAAILGYSNAGQRVALPALVKTLESSTPYACMGTIFLLMLLYTFLMVLIMLFFNIWKGQLAGVISVLTFDVFGFLLNPQTLKVLFQLPDERLYQANVAVGWISPLNHATYHMHNFGYDLLPRLWQTYTIFSGLIITIFLLSLWAIRRYNFHFTGTEGS